MQTKPEYYYKQSAVLAYKRINEKYYILLITSRNKKKWVIPKGIIEQELTAWDSAIKEAYEEAGIKGEIDNKSIGYYEYKKWGGICIVEVFPFFVNFETDHWPEKSFRKRKWFSKGKAIKKIKNRQLQKIIKNYFKNKLS